MKQTTYQPKASSIERKWHVISARGQTLGRLATQITQLLMGKHKRLYTPHLDIGDWVVVTDAKDVTVSGRKETQKMYQRYSGYPSGLHKTALGTMRTAHPERIIEHAVEGMLPNNRLRAKRMARLKVFAGLEHPYGDKVGTRQ